VSDGDRAAPHVVDVERLQRRTHADDVDDRVERTDLVEFDLCRIDAVDRRFDLAEP
jgi:hypothetical protein